MKFCTDLNYDPKTNTGRWFDYATYGAGCSLVEIDCLTGDHSVLKTDIVMDLGESLNPAIDIGQIEGAFAQVGFSLPLPFSVWFLLLQPCQLREIRDARAVSKAFFLMHQHR